MKIAAAIGTAFLVAVLFFYLPFAYFLDQYHVGIVRNTFTGEVTCATRGGFHVAAPWVQVARVDTRPIRVCLTSTARTMNCKLVQFDPSAYRKFIQIQGFSYYWWANRLSFNSGYCEEYRGMKDILRGYAFSIEQYPFITILRDYPGP